MRTTTLGAAGPRIGRIGLGCMGMSWAYGEQRWNEAESISLIHEAIDSGMTFLDTADQYGPFTNEYLVGKAIAGRRDQVVLATKGGLIVDGARKTYRNGRPEHLIAACDASLLRLGVDHVDLYQLHRVDPAVPLEDSWGAMAELVKQGKATAIGLSEVGVAEIKSAHAIHPVATVQSELSLWTRNALDDVVPHCAVEGIGFLAFSPLGRGFLTGAIATTADLPPGDWRHGNPRFQPAAIKANQALIDVIRAGATELGHTPAQVALAWVMAQGPSVVPIPGTKTRRYLMENIEAAAVTLPETVLNRLNALPPATGARN